MKTEKQCEAIERYNIMSMTKKEIEFIKFAVGHDATRKIEFIDKPVKTVKPGNVYIPAARGDIPAYWLLVTGKVEKAVYDVVPVFTWTENTGPADIILDDNVFGEPVTVSLELACSLPESSLGESAGRLPENVMLDISKARASLHGGSIKSRAAGFMWGWEYIDEQDLRYCFHAALLKELVYLQQSLRETIFSAETVHNTGTFAGHLQLAWPALKLEIAAHFEVAAAAADDEDIQIPVVNLDLRAVLANAVPKLKCWALPDSFLPMAAGTLCYIISHENGEILGDAKLINHRIVPADKKWLADKNICLVIVQKKAK